MSLLLGAGCRRHAVPSPAATAPAAMPALANFPMVRSMLLGEYPAQIKPMVSIPLAAPVDGELLFHATEPRQFLEKGVVWAEVVSGQLAEEKRELEFKIRENKHLIEEELAAARREEDYARYALNDPVLRDVPQNNAIRVTPELLGRLEEKRRFLADKLGNCGAAERFALGQKERALKLTMPFSGELSLYLPVSRELSTFQVTANLPLGLVRDKSSIYLNLAVRDPHVVAIETSRLSATVTETQGEPIRCEFHDQQILQVQHQDLLVYRFAIPSERAADAMRLIGSGLTCELWVRSGTPFHRIGKIELATLLDGKGPFTTWMDAIHTCWPSARLLYTGRNDLAVIPFAGDR